MVVLPLPGPATVATTVGRRPTASDGDRADLRERDFRKPTRNHDCHSDLGSAACQPSAEAGAGPVAERARADEFDAVGGACGEASEMAIAVLHGVIK